MKIHLKSKEEKTVYNRSPHIYDAIEDGVFSACGKIVDGHVTTDITDVTCCRCLNLFDGRKAEDKRNHV